MSKLHHDTLPPLTTELLQKYRDDTLTPNERALIEAWRAQDPFAADALDGVLDATDGASFTSDVAALRDRLQRRSHRAISGWDYSLRIAASLAILLMAGLVTYGLLSESSKVANREEPGSTEVSLSVKNAKRPALIDPIAALPPQPLTDTFVAGLPNRQPLARVFPSKKLSETAVQTLADHFEIEALPALSPIRDATQLPLSSPPSTKRQRNALIPTQEISRPTRIASSTEKTYVVAGQVIDQETGELLPGVNVLVKGTTQGVVTDIDGHYQLTIHAQESPPVLVFNSIGYVAEEISVTEEKTINAALIADVQALSEVVVVGYGSQARAKEETESVRIAARPSTGTRAFKKYLRDNARFPNQEQNSRKRVVKVTFTVFPDGELGSFSIDRSAGEWFGQEAIRLIKQGPAWRTATENGNPVSQKVTVKVRFGKETGK